MTDETRALWERYDARSIPTKTDLTALERVERSLGLERARVLDLGCGAGAVSARLARAGHDVVGVDINARAIELARSAAPGGRFYVRDVASKGGLDLEAPAFDFVVCQLVISIVGGAESRKALVSNAFDALAPGGLLYLSASGRSETINPGYRELYERDLPLTGEYGTYFSRDERGNILYRTHHFEEEELRTLLEDAGLEAITLERKREASSRRRDEAAYFLYASCSRPAA